MGSAPCEIFIQHSGTQMRLLRALPAAYGYAISVSPAKAFEVSDG